MSSDPPRSGGTSKAPNKNDAQLIGPVDLSPAGKTSGKSPSQRRIALFAMLGIMLALAATGGALLLRHPAAPTGKIAAQKPAPQKELPPSAPPAPPPSSEPGLQPSHPEPARDRLREKTADQQLSQYLKAQKHLEDLGAAQWGSDAYNEIRQLAQEGDTQYRNKGFADAATLYARAAQKAGKLADEAPEALKMLVRQGLADITAGDGKSALQKLQTAGKVDPRNPEIEKLMRRAAQAEKVQQLFLKGQQLEKNNAAGRALVKYRQALELDPEASRVRNAYRDLSVRVAETDYRRFMSRGLMAFERREYSQARTSLLKARALKPQASGVLDALAQVNAALQKQRMDTLRQQALAAEAAENWKLAMQSYQAVLAMDDRIAFAVDGKQRAEMQLSLLKRLDFFLKKPHSLQDERQLDKARRLIRKLEAAPVKGPRTVRHTVRLKGLVRAYATPVPITIQSDGLTSVAVYRVGRLGRFTVHRLHLRPGIYTMVGSRDGYQDVRRKIVVEPGQPSLQITIACKTKV